jgi:hypothetical protein
VSRDFLWKEKFFFLSFSFIFGLVGLSWVGLGSKMGGMYITTFIFAKNLLREVADASV